MANTYIPRLVAPDNFNKNYITLSGGGYNRCILGNSNAAEPRIGQSALPNCTGYAWGRWREILGKDHRLSTNNAKNWYTNNDGYARGQIPQLGAVMCWSGLYGHVAIVEEITSDGAKVSMSNWSSPKFVVKHYAYPFDTNTLQFQGFIYLPISFQDSNNTIFEQTSLIDTNPKQLITLDQNKISKSVQAFISARENAYKTKQAATNATKPTVISNTGTSTNNNHNTGNNIEIPVIDKVLDKGSIIKLSGDNFVNYNTTDNIFTLGNSIPSYLKNYYWIISDKITQGNNTFYLIGMNTAGNCNLQKYMKASDVVWVNSALPDFNFIEREVKTLTDNILFLKDTLETVITTVPKGSKLKIVAGYCKLVNNVSICKVYLNNVSIETKYNTNFAYCKASIFEDTIVNNKI